MLPRWHIVSGAILALVLYLAVPGIRPLYLCLVFLSTFLIDFDHYMCAVKNTGNLSLFNALEYHEQQHKEHKEHEKKGIKIKGDFHIFHTIEFHILVGLLSFLWIGFFYVFMGMMLHSILDIVNMTHDNALHRREFFFFHWINKIIFVY